MGQKDQTQTESTQQVNARQKYKSGLPVMSLLLLKIGKQRTDYYFWLDCHLKHIKAK